MFRHCEATVIRSKSSVVNCHMITCAYFRSIPLGWSQRPSESQARLLVGQLCPMRPSVTPASPSTSPNYCTGAGAGAGAGAGTWARPVIRCTKLQTPTLRSAARMWCRAPTAALLCGWRVFEDHAAISYALLFGRSHADTCRATRAHALLPMPCPSVNATDAVARCGARDNCCLHLTTCTCTCHMRMVYALSLIHI